MSLSRLRVLMTLPGYHSRTTWGINPCAPFRNSGQDVARYTRLRIYREGGGETAMGVSRNPNLNTAYSRDNSLTPESVVRQEGWGFHRIPLHFQEHVNWLTRIAASRGIVLPAHPVRKWGASLRQELVGPGNNLLTAIEGKPLILEVVSQLAWTDFCAAQMASLEDNREMRASLNCVSVGISVDSRPCMSAWAENLSLTHAPLLCDFWSHGAFAQKYGLFRDANGFPERANVIVDKNLAVVFVKVYPVHSIPDIQEVIATAKKLPMEDSVGLTRLTERSIANENRL